MNQGSDNMLNQRGFTLIELLWVMAIIGILTALGFMNFIGYRQNAEFAKAEITMGDARTAAEAGYDFIVGKGFVFGASGSNGEPLAGDLLGAFPGLSVSDRVKIQASFFECGIEGRVMSQITVYACEGGKGIWYLSTCGGFNMKGGPFPINDGFC